MVQHPASAGKEPEAYLWRCEARSAARHADTRNLGPSCIRILFSLGPLPGTHNIGPWHDRARGRAEAPPEISAPTMLRAAHSPLQLRLGDAASFFSDAPSKKQYGNAETWAKTRSKAIMIRASNRCVHLYDTTRRSQNAEQLRENAGLCRRCKHQGPLHQGPTEISFGSL